MYFEYENDFLVKSRIHDGTSDELADIVEMLEDDMFDVLHTSPEELDDERFRLLGETDDEYEPIEEGTLLAGEEEARTLYLLLVDLHKRAKQALVEREASEEYDRQIRADQVNDYSDRCCPQPRYTLYRCPTANFPPCLPTAQTSTPSCSASHSANAKAPKR